MLSRSPEPVNTYRIFLICLTVNRLKFFFVYIVTVTVSEICYHLCAFQLKKNLIKSFWFVELWLQIFWVENINKMENTFSVLYGVLSLSSFQKYFMCSARVWKRPFLGTFSHVFIFFKQEFICSAPSLQLQKEKERFWVNICSIFFSERIYLFSNRHLQPSYTMIKSVLGVGTFFLVLVQQNFEREHI